MDPISAMTVASMGTTLAGAGVGSVGALMGGQAQQSMYNYRANLARINADIARQNANFEYQKGEVEAQQKGMAVAQEVGKTKVIQAASGIDVNRGTTVDVRASEEKAGLQDQAMLRSNAARKAFGFNVQAMGDDAQAALDVQAGKNAVTASEFQAGATLLSGAGSVADKWVSASQKGVPLFQKGGPMDWTGDATQS